VASDQWPVASKQWAVVSEWKVSSSEIHDRVLLVQKSKI